MDGGLEGAMEGWRVAGRDEERARLGDVRMDGGRE